ncbi:MAG: hypothetical protein JST68_11255 [Bacteroidetes bacterium]|nr:hypothetical protein [Bacteroidota bacterium]
MDTKLIRQYGEEILSYRLRTARQKKRMQYEDFDKQLLKLHRERHMLWNKRRNLEPVPLIPPIQRGWKRTFVLRQDAAGSRYAAFYQGILDKINTLSWSHRKDFLVKKRSRGRKYYVVKGQELKTLNGYEFNKLNLTEEEKAHFHVHYSYDWTGGRFMLVAKYVFSEPWRFVLKIQPNMIDKVKALDQDLEEAIKRIDNYLERNACEYRQRKLTRGHYKWWCHDFELPKYRNPLKNQPLYRTLDKLKDEQL